MRLGIILLVVFASTLAAKADFVQTREFLETCSAQDTERRIACAAYVAGVTDSYLNSGQYCVPPRTDPKEITLFTKDFILKTRAIQNNTPVGMILLALKARYPCTGQRGATLRINPGPGSLQFNFSGFIR